MDSYLVSHNLRRTQDDRNEKRIAHVGYVIIKSRGSKTLLICITEEPWGRGYQEPRARSVQLPYLAYVMGFSRSQFIGKQV